MISAESAPRESTVARTPEPASRVAVYIDQEEADALLTLLLHAAEQPRASIAVTDRLLFLFAEAQRALNRAEAAATDASPERF